MAEDRGSPARALHRPRALATGAPGPDELRRAREVLEAVAPFLGEARPPGY